MSQSPNKKRQDWEDNHRRISQAVLSHYRSSHKTPTQAEIAKLTGLSRETVGKHLREMDFDKLFDRNRAMMALHSDVLMMAVINSAIKGSFGAQKLYFQIVYGWAEPKSFTHVIEDNSTALSPEEQAELDLATRLWESLVIQRHEERKKKTQPSRTADTQPAP